MTDMMDDRDGLAFPFVNSDDIFGNSSDTLTTREDYWNDDVVNDSTDSLPTPLPSQEQGYFGETDQSSQVPMDPSNSDQLFYGSDPYSTTEPPTTCATSSLSLQPVKALTFGASYSKNVSAVSQHLEIEGEIFSFNSFTINQLKTDEQISEFLSREDISNFVNIEEGWITPILFNDLGIDKTLEETDLLKKRATLLYAIILTSQNLKLINYFLASIQQCIASYTDDAHINILIALFKNAMASQRPVAIKLFTDNGAIKDKIVKHLNTLTNERLIDLFKNAMASECPVAIKLFTGDERSANSTEKLRKRLIEIINAFEPEQFMKILKNSFSSQRYDAGMFFLENFHNKIEQLNKNNAENKIEKIQLTSSVDHLHISVYTPASTDITDSSSGTQQIQYTFYNPTYFTDKGLRTPEGEQQPLKEFLTQQFSNLFTIGKKITRAERDETEIPGTIEEITDGTRPQTGNGEKRQRKRRRRTRNEQIPEENLSSSSTTGQLPIPMETLGVVEKSDAFFEKPAAEPTGEPSNKRRKTELPYQNDTELSDQASVPSMIEGTFNSVEPLVPTSLYAARVSAGQDDGCSGMPSSQPENGLNYGSGVDEMSDHPNDSGQSSSGVFDSSPSPFTFLGR